MTAFSLLPQVSTTAPRRRTTDSSGCAVARPPGRQPRPRKSAGRAWTDCGFAGFAAHFSNKHCQIWRVCVLFAGRARICWISRKTPSRFKDMTYTPDTCNKRFGSLRSRYGRRTAAGVQLRGRRDAWTHARAGPRAERGQRPRLLPSSPVQQLYNFGGTVCLYQCT